MPSGSVHDKIGLTMASILTVTTYTGLSAITGDTLSPALPSLALGLGIVLGTLYFSPDLDIQSNNHARWGVFKSIWTPYKVLVPHRGKLSHTPVIGFVARLTYFLICFIISNAIIYPLIGDHAIEAVKWLLITLFIYQPMFLVGLWFSHLLHIGADYIKSSFKKRKKHHEHEQLSRSRKTHY